MNTLDNFYEKLKSFNYTIDDSFSYEDEGGYVRIYSQEHIGSNYPWLYIHFECKGLVSLHTLNEIERRYQAFVALEGGSLEGIYLAERGGFLVKLIYVEGKKEAPVEI